jgi:signal transduction histidine kinase
MMARDLQLRLIATHLAVTLAALILLGGGFAVILTRSIQATHQRDLQHEATAVAGQLDGAFAHDASRWRIQTLIRHDSRLLGKRIILVNSAGRLRFDSSRWTPFSRGSWKVDISALHRGRTARFDTTGRIDVQSPLHVYGRSAGAMVLVTTAADTVVPLGTVLPALAVMLAILLFAWLLIGAHFVRLVSSPLRRISEGLVWAGHGQYNRPIPEEGWSEARELARRYNEMVAEVARSQATLRDFVANAAHELKTPVALVAGFARSLDDGTALRGDAVAEAVGFIQMESEHLARIVDTLFALTSLDADPDALDLRLDNPAEPLRTVHGCFLAAANEQGKRLDLVIPVPPTACVIDTERVTSALSNLVANALDHTVAGDSIVLSLDTTADSVHYTVSDTGAGIPQGDIPHVFDRFYRGHGQPRAGHAGLGLALVHEVAIRHGGSVKVESDAGEGATFTFAIPRVTACAGRERMPA